MGLSGPDSEVTFTPGSLVGPSAGSSKPLIWIRTAAWTVLGGQLWTDWGTALGSGDGDVKRKGGGDMEGEGGPPSKDAAGRGAASPEGFSLLMFSEGVASPGVVAWLVSVS